MERLYLAALIILYVAMPKAVLSRRDVRLTAAAIAVSE